MNAPKPGSVSELVRQLNEDGALEKVAAQGGFGMTPEDEETVKIAEEIDASGRLFGKAAAEAMIEKLAEAAAPATGPAEPSTGDMAVDQSVMKSVANKVMNFKGKESPGSVPSVQGSNPGVVAETDAPAQVAKPNPEEKTGG
jgi:hypothetical protein